MIRSERPSCRAPPPLTVIGFQRFHDQFAFKRIDQSLEIRFRIGMDHRGAGRLSGLERRGQIVSVDHDVVGRENRPFYAVFQLADVAGPMVGHQHIDGRSRNARNVLAVETVVFFQKMIRQENDVAGTLMQTRQMNRKDVQPVIKILAKEIFPISFSRSGSRSEADIRF